MLLELLHFGIKLNPCVLNGIKISLIMLMFQSVRQGGALSPKLFATYIDDLSNELALCKSGCYINERCMNHVIYADDISLLAPSAISLKQMLDVCFNFSIRNGIILNPMNQYLLHFSLKRANYFVLMLH